LSTPKVDVLASKDIEFVKKLASPKKTKGSILKGSKTFLIAAKHSDHSLKGPTSLLAIKRISTIVKKKKCQP